MASMVSGPSRGCTCVPSLASSNLIDVKNRSEQALGVTDGLVRAFCHNGNSKKRQIATRNTITTTNPVTFPQQSLYAGTEPFTTELLAIKSVTNKFLTTEFLQPSLKSLQTSSPQSSHLKTMFPQPILAGMETTENDDV